MPNLTHSIDSPTVAPSANPSCPTEGPSRLGQVFALLTVPFIVVGYHVAVTVLKLAGRRDA
jgi:hypothetical protein